MENAHAGGGLPDIFVSAGGPTLPVEIKNPLGKNRLEKSQKKVFAEYKGAVFIARTLDDVQRIAGIARKLAHAWPV